ncbi:MAG: ABC transporter permease [Bradyrhizobium sp.]|nr:ABC transporter permease [Bradyrhizobium sp.]
MLDLASVDTPRNRLLSVLLLAGLLVSWEVVIRVFGIAPFILPAPSAVAQALWRGFANGPFLQHTLITVAEVLLGFIFGSAVGLVLGVGIALNRHIAYFVYPYIVMFLSMPKVALAPLIVLWFGLGITSKIVTAALVTFFPVMVNTIAGLNAANRDGIDLIRSLGGTERQIFTMLRLPAALPMIVAGLEIAMTLSLIGTVVAELIGAEQGLGMLMQSMNFSMDTAGVFSILIVLAIVGLVLNQALKSARRRMIFWENAGRAASTPSKRASPATEVENTLAVSR